MLTAIPGAKEPPQIDKSSNILFENKDFAIVPLNDLRKTNLENQSLSGLLVFRRDVGGFESTGDVWKFSGPPEDSKMYYWADSAKGMRLTTMTGGKYGSLVVAKSGERLNRKLFNTDWPRAFTEFVGGDLQSIAVLVDRSEQGIPPSEREQVQAHAGFEDLAFKSKWISSSGHGGFLLSPFVNVTARTVDQSGAVVQRCTVWYVPLAWEDDKQHWKRFDQFSSPTSQSIPVGQFKMWASRNGRNGAKTIVNPGDDLKPIKNIDLDAP